MGIRQLRQFVVLAETLNFHRAAERLNMAQPPLSTAIRKLEKELGVALFMREPRKLSLTVAGTIVLGHAWHPLRDIEDVSPRNDRVRHRRTEFVLVFAHTSQLHSFARTDSPLPGARIARGTIAA